MEPVECSIFENMAHKRGQFTGHWLDLKHSWTLRYWVDSAEVDPQTGRVKRVQMTRFIGYKKEMSKRDATREAQRILADLDRAHLVPSSAKTFGEFVELRFRPDVIAQLKPTGKAFYESILRQHVLPALGTVPLRQLSTAHVQNLCNLARQKISPRTKQPLSTKTVLEIKKAVQAILNHAKAHKWYFGDLPTEGVRLPEMVQKQRRALTWEQVCALSAALPEPAATLVIFLALTGLRIGEACGLRWARVNLTSYPKPLDGEILPPYSIAVRESFVMGKYQTLKPSPAGPRIIPIPEWFVQRLRTLAGHNALVEHMAVFANSTGTAPLDQHNLAARVLKPTAAKLGMPWVTWHCLRHTYATLTDPVLTQAERMRLLGHSTPQMTTRYTHPEIEGIRKKLDSLPRLQ